MKEIFPPTPVLASQFQNLLRSPVSFLLFDLRPKLTEPSLPRSIASTTSEIVGEAQKRTPNLEQPVIVVCEDGTSSQKAAQLLSEVQFKNVYWLKDGTRSLKGV